MGATISQEQLNAHMARQEALIQQLTSVVDMQARSLAALGHAAVDYEVDGAAEKDIAEPALVDEVDGLRQQARGAERKRPLEDEVDEAEKALAPEGWTEPTEEEERGFMATKPWLGAMAPPTGFEYGKTDEKPRIALELEHVYGYRSNRVRNNIAWICKSKIAYFAAGVGIVHDLEKNKQIFFRGHSDDIVCLAYHKGKNIIATGETGRFPAIHVWDAETGQELAKMAGFHRRAVVSVGFSRDGDRLVSVGLDDKHSVAVYAVSTGNLLAESEGDTARILDVQFNMANDADGNADFITCGVKHIKFWTLEGRNLTSKKGLIGDLGTRQPYLAVTSTAEYVVLGCQSGELYLFKSANQKLVKVIAAHQEAIFGLTSGPANTLFTGGKDGYVSRWDLSTMKKTGSINLNKAEDAEVLTHTTNSVRAVAILGDDIDGVCCGTVTSSIFTASFSDSSRVTRVHQSHYGDLGAKHNYGELWGLATSPTSQAFVSAGEDGTLRLWNAVNRVCETQVMLGAKAQCVAWSADGKHIAAGLANGSVVFLDGRAEEVKTITKCRRRIQCLKFSPSGKFLAAGSADNVIDIYKFDGDTYGYAGRLKGHSSVILKIDFSVDEKFLQTCSQAYELLFYNLESMEQHTRSRELKDTTWATFTSILGWDVQGIWPKNSDGSDVNAVARSHAGNLLATAEDTGLVKVFQFPCVGGGLDKQGALLKRPDSERATGHSEHVTEVAWTAGDQRLISAGGGDLSLFQWKVNKTA